MSKLTLKTIVIAIEEHSGQKVTEKECEGIAKTFDIDFTELDDVQLVRAVILMAVTKKLLKSVTGGIPQCFQFNMDAIDVLVVQVAETIAKEQKNEQIH
jgi:phage shock protein PspC (stress-responsive transcriptional regulator)